MALNSGYATQWDTIRFCDSRFMEFSCRQPKMEIPQA